jgi:hypothetical protein
MIFTSLHPAASRASEQLRQSAQQAGDFNSVRQRNAIDSSPLGRTLRSMQASPIRAGAQTQACDSGRIERASPADEIDLSLLEDSLAKSVWERMLANDDALRLADLLQAAMLKTRAKS